MFKLILIFILLSCAPAWALELVRIQSGLCSTASENSVSQGILLSQGGRTYVLSSDLFVMTLNTSETICHQGTIQGKTFDLQLIRADLRQGLALFTLDNDIPVPSFKVADKAGSKMKTKWLSSNKEESASLQTLQTRSQRSFFPSDQLVIEAKANLPSESLGAAVFNEADDVIGVISRYQLIFEVGVKTRVERLSPNKNYKAPIILPWKYVNNWIQQTISGETGFPWQARIVNDKTYEIQIGPLNIIEDCRFANYSNGKQSPIGGFDGYGIGGYDSYEIGGLDRAASVCEINLKLASGSASDLPSWVISLLANYVPGSSIKLAGLMRRNIENQDLYLLSAFSLDHFFQMIETNGSQAFYRWNVLPQPLRPFEMQSRQWAKDFARLNDQYNQLQTEIILTDPEMIYVMNQLRLFNLILSSTSPEILPMQQWQNLRAFPESHSRGMAYKYLTQSWSWDYKDLIKKLDEIWKK